VNVPIYDDCLCADLTLNFRRVCETFSVYMPRTTRGRKIVRTQNLKFFFDRKTPTGCGRTGWIVFEWPRIFERGGMRNCVTLQQLSSAFHCRCFRVIAIALLLVFTEGSWPTWNVGIGTRPSLQYDKFNRV